MSIKYSGIPNMSSYFKYNSFHLLKIIIYLSSKKKILILDNEKIGLDILVIGHRTQMLPNLLNQKLIFYS